MSFTRPRFLDLTRDYYGRGNFLGNFQTQQHPEVIWGLLLSAGQAPL